MGAKTARQQAILRLIKEYKIKDQNELVLKLKEIGFCVTQATASRDINELRLIKLPDGDGAYCYGVRETQSHLGKTPAELLSEIFPQSVTDISFAGNIVVIKCLNGMAQAVCERLDNARLDLVVGTIAGDNTIFVLLKSESSAIELVNKLRGFFR